MYTGLQLPPHCPTPTPINQSNEILEWLTLLPILMQIHSGGYSVALGISCFSPILLDSDSYQNLFFGDNHSKQV